jgi:CBS domain-containing protein
VLAAFQFCKLPWKSPRSAGLLILQDERNFSFLCDEPRLKDNERSFKQITKTTRVGFSLASEDTLGRVMSSPVTTMDAKGTLGVAAQLMIQQDIGSVVVIEGKNPIGIITERDITKQVIKGNDVLKKPIKQVMSKPLVTATPTMPVQDAFELMLKNRIRRLPILEGNDMKGIVTTQDIMRWVLRVSYEPNIPRHIKAILEAR